MNIRNGTVEVDVDATTFATTTASKVEVNESWEVKIVQPYETDDRTWDKDFKKYEKTGKKKIEEAHITLSYDSKEKRLEFSTSNAGLLEGDAGWNRDTLMEFFQKSLTKLGALGEKKAK